MKLHYIDLKHKPTKDEVVCEFYVEPASGISIELACENVAGESSIGTWTTISTMNPSIAKKLKPHVFFIDKNTNTAKIAYPSALFEAGNLPEILSSIAGNVYGMKALNNLRLQDISFPKSIMKPFKGPLFGISGVRDMLNVELRPLVGTIVKPKVGLNAKQHAQVAYEAWLGGLDAVKDDENLSSMKFNRFEDRVKATLKLRDKAEHLTGEKKVYFANVTAETNEMLRRAKLVKQLGGEYVMIDIITSGWAALQTLRNAELGLALHAHRAGHGMFTENPKHGMSMLVVAKLARLVGVDQIHVGAIVGKMKGKASAVAHIGEEIENMFIDEEGESHMLEQNWWHIKPIFPVCSGGMHPGLIHPLIDIMGRNIIIQAGGGVHGHPKGTRAGGKAMRQAVEAYMEHEDAEKYARTHPELKEALRQWKSITYKKV